MSREKVHIPETKPHIFMRGNGKGKTAIVWSESSSDNNASATFKVEAPDFIAFGISFKVCDSQKLYAISTLHLPIHVIFITTILIKFLPLTHMRISCGKHNVIEIFYLKCYLNFMPHP